MKNFLKQNIKNQVALTIYNTTCQDLKTFSWGHVGFFKELKYFIKSDYAKYIEQDKEHKPSEKSLRDLINHYWIKFQSDTRYLNLF